MQFLGVMRCANCNAVCTSECDHSAETTDTLTPPSPARILAPARLAPPPHLCPAHILTPARPRPTGRPPQPLPCPPPQPCPPPPMGGLLHFLGVMRCANCNAVGKSGERKSKTPEPTGSGVICGGWGIRTPEGLHPTRFPSVRHRPLGESSVHTKVRAQIC